MARRCNNIVQFSGDPEALKEIEWLFRAMDALQNQTRQGQLPPFVDVDTVIGHEECHFFGIGIYEGKIFYETNWNPNTATLVQIADRYNVDFVHVYAELSRSIFGEATYKDGKFTDLRLNEDDFDSYNYDEDEKVYVFEGLFYDSDIEILEIMLDIKKSEQNNSLGLGR